MKNKNIAVFYGTSDGREILNFLADFHCEMHGFVATQYAQEMDVPKSTKLHIGRLEYPQMVEIFSSEKFDLVIDATHPYAVEVSQHIKSACETSGIKYIRLLRETDENSQVSNAKYFQNTLKLCEYLNQVEGNVFLSTGSKDLLEISKNIQPQRIFARVLPAIQSLEICEQAGIKKKQIIACEGPFSVQSNTAMLQSANAKFFVTKQTGKAGGFFEKVEAAQKLGITLCVLMQGEKPQMLSGEKDDCYNITSLKKHLATQLTESCQREITIVSTGVGEEGYITSNAKNVLQNAHVVFGGKRILAGIQTSGQIYSTYKIQEISQILHANPHYRKIAICGSGDLAFHSIAKSARDAFSKDFCVSAVAGIGVVSYFFTAIGDSYEDCILTSMHGKENNIAVLVSQNKKVFTLLGDANALLAKLCEYNLGDVEVYIGENLSYKNEKIHIGSASQLKDKKFSALSVALIKNKNAKSNTDLKDSDFVRGKIPMTKQEIRRICIAKLGVEKSSVVIDIGGGTGSVSCAIASVCSKGKCYSVECVEEGINLIRENSRKLHLDNVIPIFGKAPEAIQEIETPTHVFIGGSRGNLKEIFQAVLAKNPKVKIVATAIAMETISEVMQLTKQLSLNCEVSQVQVSNAQKHGEYNLMKGENPVYIFTINDVS